MLALLAAALLAQAVPPQLQSTAVNPAALPSAPAIAVDPGAVEPQSVHDRSPVERALLDAHLREYAAGEKRAAWWWLGTGVSALAAGGALGGAQSDVAHGASYPLLDISVVQLAGALWLFWRSGDQVEELSALLARDRCAFLAQETARMHRAALRLKIAQPLEALALVGGGAMAGVGAAGHHDFLQGAGFGLIAQSVITLVFDQFAAARVQTYQRALDEGALESRTACGERLSP